MSVNSVLGGQGKGADPDLFTNLIQQLFNAKIKLVTGYPGNADIMLAMQRGEVDGLCGLSYSTLKSTHPEWLRDHDVNLIVQAAVEKSPELPDTPSLLDLATDTKQRQIIALAVAPQAMARPFALTPDVPSERLQAVRSAFDSVMKDPAFLAEATRLKLDVAPMSGAKIDELVKQLYATPPDVVAAAARAIGG